MKVRVLSVGRDRSGWFEPAVQAYAARLSHYTRFELLELREVKGRDVAAARDLESEAILARRLPGDALVALDEKGAAMNSLELSRLLGEAQTRSQDLLFVVGGDQGLGPPVRAAARWTLSLSPLTLPHRLARLVLVEQIYRGFTLLRGEPYHHGPL